MGCGRRRHEVGCLRWCDGSFPKNFIVLEFVLVRYIRRKDDCHKAAHSTVGEEHKKYK